MKINSVEGFGEASGTGLGGWMKGLLSIYNVCYSIYNLTNRSNSCNFLVRQKLPLPPFFRLRKVPQDPCQRSVAGRTRM